MRDQDKPKAQLIIELAEARERVASLEAAEAEYKRSGQRALELAIEEVKITIAKNFLSSLASFVTTPLAVMKATVLSLPDVPPGEALERQLTLLEAQVGHLERLFDNMILMTQLDSLTQLERQVLDLNRLVQQVFDRFRPQAEQHAISLELERTNDFLRLIGNAALIKNAVAAVVTNALDFTPRGGAITILVYVQDRDAIIEVRDTGVGIDEADMPHIFKRFWWANRVDHPNPGSVGLGLALTRKIAELHGGRVEAESTPGEGSTFWIILPQGININKA